MIVSHVARQILCPASLEWLLHLVLKVNELANCEVMRGWRCTFLLYHYIVPILNNRINPSNLYPLTCMAHPPL